jgi:hypothetical protein
VFNTNFMPVTPAFTDPRLPRGYAPFNIVPIGSPSGLASAAKFVVTYAVQDAARHDDVAGMSHWNSQYLRFWWSVASSPNLARPTEFSVGRGARAREVWGTCQSAVNWQLW